MNDVIQAVKGTRDYYPEEMAVRRWLYDNIRQVSESFGYQEWEGPFLEKIELYAAKSGEEIVEKQSYVFEDRSGERIALRPELTPTLARLVAKRQPQLVFPLRWWSFGPFWRYERPQKGRGREFFQWNIDLIGDHSPEGDAELAVIAATFLQKIGFKSDEVNILVNNRKLMEQKTEALGIDAEMRPAVYKLIDRRDKLKTADWENYAEEIGLSSTQIDSLMDILENDQLWQESDELRRFFKTVEIFQIKDYINFAPHIIRGLDYYTGTVFEAWDTAGDFRSLFGGGRYDNLVDDVGGKPVPAVGFAAGNLVITLLLEKLGRLPTVGNSPAQVLVTIFDSEHILPSLLLADELRQSGMKIATYPNPVKLAKQFKYADRIGTPLAIVLGPDELASNQVTVKDLRSGDQHNIPRDQFPKAILDLLEGDSAS